MKYKSLITFCFIGFSVFAADDYGYSEHSGLNLKFYVEKCNSEMPGLIARFSKLTSDDLASFRVIYEGVSEENNAAKMAYRSGLKLTHMPPKKALDKCFTYISKHMDLQIEAMTRYDEMIRAGAYFDFECFLLKNGALYFITQQKKSFFSEIFNVVRLMDEKQTKYAPALTR
ncbi:hypothetical protein [Aeromonas media]|uniref:Uncharacterized protein n=1 Tax=Aeromonas media TaxID=651 RepID=A0AAE6SI99_AERME|nr:hypothetical protein [Aeromonas media]QHQ50981.1 hypothetical protein GWI30_08825 [Aeromonas media]